MQRSKCRENKTCWRNLLHSNENNESRNSTTRRLPTGSRFKDSEQRKELWKKSSEDSNNPSRTTHKTKGNSQLTITCHQKTLSNTVEPLEEDLQMMTALIARMIMMMDKEED